MVFKDIICGLAKMCGCDKQLTEDISKLRLENKELEYNLFEIEMIKDLVQEDLDELTEKYNEIVDLIPVETDYSCIPKEWKEISEKDLVTDKYTYYGTNIKQSMTDLLDSSYLSRQQALSLIGIYKFKQDTPIEEILLKVYNHYIKDIKYLTNKEQYGKVDQWDNGDLAIITKKADCDISSRLFIRVMKDILSALDHEFDTKHLFLCIGMFTSGNRTFGHAWVQVPVKGKWYLFELTKDSEVSSLEGAFNDKYNFYFCHNNRKGWYKNSNWKVFL